MEVSVVRRTAVAVLVPIAVLLWAAMGHAQASEAQPAPLPPEAPAATTLAELEGVAMANNPTLSQAAAHVHAARGKHLQAGLYPNPEVGYQGEEMGLQGTAGKQGAFWHQEIVTAGKLGLSRSVAGHEVRQAEWAYHAQEQRVRNDLHVAFYEALAAQRIVELQQQLVRLAEEGSKTAERLRNAKEVSRVDVLQTNLEAESAALALQNAQHQCQSAYRRLATIAGMSGPTWDRLEGDMAVAGPELTWETALAKLLSESPELGEAQAAVQRARCAVARECAQRIPNLNAQTSVQYDYAVKDTIVGASIGVRLPLFDRNQGNIVRAQGELMAAEQEVQRVVLVLQDRLAAAFRRYENARLESQRYATRLAPLAKESLDLVSNGYRAGEVDYLALLNAQRTYFRVHLAHQESLRELRTSAISIDGLLLTGGLDTPGERPRTVEK